MVVECTLAKKGKRTDNPPARKNLKLMTNFEGKPISAQDVIDAMGESEKADAEDRALVHPGRENIPPGINFLFW